MKAIVVKTGNKDAVLLSDDGVFIKARNQNNPLGAVVDMDTPARKKPFAALAAVAAAVVVLISVGVFAYSTSYYFISMDVNPGMIIAANRFERALSIEALNTEAKNILNDIEWKNREIEKVIQNAALKIEEQGYLSDHGEILLAAAGRNEEKTAEMAKRLAISINELKLGDVAVTSEAVGYDMVQSAKAWEMTPGKYNLITKLLGEHLDEANVETFRNQSVKELMESYTAAKGLPGKETAVEQRSMEATQTATETRQHTEQRGTEATQTATETRQYTEQRGTGGTQAATETRQNTEQRGMEATQSATETRQQTEQRNTEASQPASETRQQTTQQNGN